MFLLTTPHVTTATHHNYASLIYPALAKAVPKSYFFTRRVLGGVAGGLELQNRYQGEGHRPNAKKVGS